MALPGSAWLCLALPGTAWLCQTRMGSLNPFFGIGPGIKAVEAAAELSGTKVYVYDVNSFTLVNNKPFRSIRKAAEAMPISTVTLASKLDTGKPFKRYYYYSGRATPQTAAPK